MNADEVLLKLVVSIAGMPDGSIMADPLNTPLIEAADFLVQRGLLVDDQLDEFQYHVVEVE